MLARARWFPLLLLITITIFACNAVSGVPDTPVPPTPTITPTSTPLPPIPVQPGEEHPSEPVFINGDIPYTSPFFLNTISEPFVLLEDQAGFVNRDEDFQFPIEGQAVGPVTVLEDGTVTYSLALPSVPQGTQLDLDNNHVDDKGVQVFAIAYWSNTWGGPFLEDRDGTGWSTAYASTIVDPDNDNEISGGLIIVWAPDDDQGFPVGFGDDGLLFSEDDPTEEIPAGYSFVDLDQTPFKIFKVPRLSFNLNEGDIAVNDYSELSYTEAFNSLFEKASQEYPFTQEKGIQWEQLYERVYPDVKHAEDIDDYYRALRAFVNEIPDAHVGLSFNADVFFEERGGGIGIVLTELSDHRVIVTGLLPDTPAADADIELGAEILSIDDTPISEKISDVIPDFGPYSTEHHKRLEQVVFLTRFPPDEKVTISYQNPGETNIREETLTTEVEYGSLFESIPTFMVDEVALPIEGEILDDSGLGYIRINTFSDDYSLMAKTWDHYMESFIENDVPGLIIDVRTNSGGSGSIALDFAGYFFEEELGLYQSKYYNDKSGKFETTKLPAIIKPGTTYFDRPVAVIVSPYCISACEGFTYAMSQNPDAIIIGHFPTAGAFGEVGRGQYELPEDISAQFPTGRPETMDGELLIEGTGVIPDITVPVTLESALGEDTLLWEAIENLLDRID